jgi:uncharacterized protein YjdB
MWSYYNENAETIEITFSSNTLFEDEYDYLCIYDYDGKAIGAYTYKQLADKTITINGKGFRIVLYTDDSEQEYGFALTNLTVKPAAKDSGNVNDKNENNDKNNHNGNSGSASGSSSGTQNVKVTKISLKGLSHNLAPNKKMSLKATVTPSNASNKGVTYKCSNTRYATVSSSGVVKAKKKGAGKTVTITATAKDGSGKKATYKIKISKKAVKSIKVTAPKTAKAGKKVKLKTTVAPKKGAYTKVAYKCLTPKYASVSAKGVVKIKKSAKGKTVKIQVKTLDGTNKKKVVKIKVNKK